MFIRNIDALQAVNALYLAQHIVLNGANAFDFKQIMRIDGTFRQFVAGFQFLPVHDLDSGTVRDQVVLALAGLIVGDDDLAFLLRILDHGRSAEFRDDREALGFSRLEKLLDTGKTLCDIIAGHAAGMESTHGQLRSGLADGLGRDNTYRFAYLNRFARRHIGAVALRTDSALGAAGQNGTDLHAFHRRSLAVHARFHNALRPSGGDHLVRAYDQLAVLIVNVFAGISSRNSVLQSLDGLLAVHERFHIHAGNGIFAFAAIDFADNQFLGYVHHSAGQITGVRRTQRCIGHTFPGAVSGHEILQYVQAFAEVGLDRQLDGPPRGIRHQSAHAGQLLDLLVAAAGAGVRHHENVVVLIQPFEQHIRQLFVRLLPGFHHRTVTLFFRDQTSAEVLADLIHRSLRLRQHFAFLCGHCHIGNRYRHGRSGGILIADGFHVVQHFRSPGCAVGVDNPLQNLLQLLFAYVKIHFQLQEFFRIAPIHVSQILRKNFVEDETSESGFHDAGHFFSLGVDLCHAHLDPGMQGTGFILISQNRFVDVFERLAFALRSGPFLCQVINSQHHVLRRHGHRSAVGRLEQVVGRQQHEAALRLRFLGKRKVHGHLVTVEVRVERSTNQRMQLDRLAFDQDGLKCLNSQPVQGRSAI